MQLIHSAQTYKNETPEFGHAMLKHFALDPGYLNLNNGSYGTTPRPVLQAVRELSDRIEANPDLFHRVDVTPLMAKARGRVAQLVGADLDEIVFVPNASMGVSTVLWNFDWEEDDIIYAFTTTYNSVSRTVQYLNDVPPHPKKSIVTLNFPMTHAEIVETFKAHISANPGKPNKKRVAIIDSLVSNPGVLLPWQELVKICKDEGIFSVIDAAHSIGQEIGINLHEVDPDFWISNCHKWLSAKRSVAVFYVPERNQHIIKTSIPASHAYISPADRKGPNFVEQFDWNGTIDFSSYVTVTDALEFREWMGGEVKINEYCHNLAIGGGKALAKILGTSVMDPDGSLTLNMVNVGLPLPVELPDSTAVNESIRAKIFAQNAFSAFYFHNNAWWTRCSAQVWNDIGDFEELGKRWLEVCADVKREFGF